MDIAQIQQRLLQLEAREAIRTLKHRYLACCDAKDVAGFRACFADGQVAIDYGAIGTFDNADDLVAVFEEVGCHPHMLEMHLAGNDQIELLDEQSARGSWTMQYQLINSQEQHMTQLTGAYEDEYRLTPDGWKICATRFVPRSCLVLKLDDTAVSRVFAGAPQNAA